MRFFLLFMILTLVLVGCGDDKKGSENEISQSRNENESSVITEGEAKDLPSEEMTLSFGYATDTDRGFGEIIEIN